MVAVAAVERRPGLQLVTDGWTVEGVEGSSIWRGIAEDRLVELPGTWTPVVPGQRVRFASDAPDPSEVFLTIYPPSSIEDRSMQAVSGFELAATGPTWTVDVPPGRYVITVSRTWESGESIVHVFGISGHEAGHGEADGPAVR